MGVVTPSYTESGTTILNHFGVGGREVTGPRLFEEVDHPKKVEIPEIPEFLIYILS